MMQLNNDEVLFLKEAVLKEATMATVTYMLRNFLREFEKMKREKTPENEIGPRLQAILDNANENAYNELMREKAKNEN